MYTAGNSAKTPASCIETRLSDKTENWVVGQFEFSCSGDARLSRTERMGVPNPCQPTRATAATLWRAKYAGKRPNSNWLTTNIEENQ